MVNHSDPLYCKSAQLEINSQDVDAELKVTEEGDPVVNLEGEVSTDSFPEPQYGTIEGVTTNGDPVKLENAIVSRTISSSSGFDITSIQSTDKITIDEIGEDRFIDEEVSITFECLCFAPHYPAIMSTDTFPIIDRPGWSAVAKYTRDHKDRIDTIKSARRPIRTAKIVVTQADQNGLPHLQIDRARERVNNILDICSFLLGTGCTTFQATIEKDGDTYTEISNTYRNIGSCMSDNNILVWGSVNDYVEHAYDQYAQTKREDYMLRAVIGQYLDSINVTRAIQGQLATTFNTIELLSKRYSDVNTSHGSTQDRIEYIVSELGIETSDLAQESESFLEQYSEDYFYSRTRQFIVHGDNIAEYNPNRNDEAYNILLTDNQLTKVFLQRLLRNLLFENMDLSGDQHRRLREIGTDDMIEHI